jgi:hypothetical protein
MYGGTKGAPRPTEGQVKWLQLIARSPLMKTYIEGDPDPRYSLQNGQTVPAPMAQVLIRNGWVKGQNAGLLDDEQAWGIDRRYEALRP